MHFKSRLTDTELEKLQALYMRAFPKSERKPWNLLLQLRKSGRSDILAVMEGDVQVGLLITLKGSYTLVDYFAIEDPFRSQGLGSKALQLFFRQHPETVILEIEEPAKDQPDTLRRQLFYHKNGMREMLFKFRLFGVDMRLEVKGKPVSFDEYRNFMAEVLGKQCIPFITRL